jgi:hypothetical protein
VKVFVSLPIRMYRSVLIGRRVTLSRTPNALTYGAAPRCHTPTIAPGIDACRITRLIAEVSAAAREEERPNVTVGPVSASISTSVSSGKMRLTRIPKLGSFRADR